MSIPYNIKHTNLDHYENIEDYLRKRLAKLDEFVDDDDTSVRADIELGKTTTDQRSGEIFRAEINLHIAGEYLRSEATREDLRAAIDEAQDDMARQLRKVQGKRETMFRKGARRIKEMIRGFRRSDDV